MDWNSKQNAVKKVIDKYGVSMTVRVSTPSTAYNASEDSYSPSDVDYIVKGVIINPSSKREKGQASKTDNIKILLSALSLPTLSEVDFRILYGAKIWLPEDTAELKPGGDILMYTVEVK